jgi:peptidoglycan/LPS O-acetylase OafA/YrhL
MKYRPEIDGLRTIAVLSVILYHAGVTVAGFNVLSGGFVGVDIFFVISGYLISALIFKELLATNTFSFAGFYERRARRILPALFTTFLVSTVLAWKILLPSEVSEFSKSIYFSMLFVSNIYFHAVGLEYGAGDSLLKPFLHTWSLSVEEQFYIITPILFIIAFRFFKHRIGLMLILIIAASLLWADWGARYYPSATFYFLPSRMWELLAGALLAFWEIKKADRGENHSYRHVFQVLGLLLIGGAVLYYNDKMLHPSFLTAAPVIGTCFLIWFANQENFITKLLSSKPFVWVGLISYSLYLWHYPIFAFVRIKHLDLQEPHVFFPAIGAVFLLSVASFFMIERPFRNKGMISRRVLIPSLPLSILLIMVSLNSFSTYVAPSAHNDSSNYFAFDPDPWYMLKDKDGKTCYERDANYCRFYTERKRKLFLVGDSQMSVQQYDLKLQLKDSDLQFVPLISGACYYAPGFEVKDDNGNVDKRCTRPYQADRRKLILENPDSIVVIGGMLPVYLSLDYFDNGKKGGYQGKYDRYFLNAEKEFKDNIKGSIMEILDNGSHVILIYPFVEPGWHLPSKLKTLIDFDNFQESIISSYEETYIPRDRYEKRMEEVFELYDSIQHPNLTRIYPHIENCDSKLCRTHDANNMYYIDTVHQSQYFAQIINKHIMEKVRTICGMDKQNADTVATATATATATEGSG